MRFQVFILTLVSRVAFAQSDSSKVAYDVSVSYLYSSIWTGHTSLKPFTLDHPQGVQLDFGIQKNSQKSWDYCHCYSRNGVSFSYVDFGNPSQLGHTFTLSAFTEPILFSSQRLTLSLRGSAGAALVNKLYDSISNKENIFFSTKLSYLLAVGVNASYLLGQKFKLHMGAQVNHISNAGKRDPNEGMNFPGIVIGMNYILNPKKFDRRPKEKFEDKSWGVLTHFFGAQRTAQASLTWPEEVRWVGGVNVGLLKRLSRLNGIGVGGEIYYDGINSVFQQQSGRQIQTTVGGVGVQHHLFFGKLLFGQQFSWFVTSNTNYRSSLYQRYFLEYEVIKNWYAGVSLKAHANHSDFLAISVGRFIKL